LDHAAAESPASARSRPASWPEKAEAERARTGWRGAMTAGHPRPHALLEPRPQGRALSLERAHRILEGGELGGVVGHLLLGVAAELRV
jgi:hypothetical protein